MSNVIEVWVMSESSSIICKIVSDYQSPVPKSLEATKIYDAQKEVSLRLMKEESYIPIEKWVKHRQGEYSRKFQKVGEK